MSVLILLVIGMSIPISARQKAEPPIYTATQKKYGYTFENNAEIHEVFSPFHRNWGDIVDVYVSKRYERWMFENNFYIRLVYLDIDPNDLNNTALKIKKIVKIKKLRK